LRPFVLANPGHKRASLSLELSLFGFPLARE
jgi:hypothetical protein